MSEKHTVGALKRRALLIQRLREGRFSLGTLLQTFVFSFILGLFVYHAFHVGFESPSRMYVRSLNVLLPGGYCELPHDKPDGGDCPALGEVRRPRWACYSEMIYALPKFVELFKRRPRAQNNGGMRIEHSFALFYILRKIQPTTVIESGAHRGHTTWIIRNALPTAKIISMDPKAPDQRLPGVTYLVGKNFIDFKDVNWESYNIDIENTAVLIDDHQASFKRLFRDNPYKFRHFIIDDNYPFQRGDMDSLKMSCDIRKFRKTQWRGIARDNFSRWKKPMTWEQHIIEAQQLKRELATYYEFPPIVDGKVGPRKNIAYAEIRA